MVHVEEKQDFAVCPLVEDADEFDNKLTETSRGRWPLMAVVLAVCALASVAWMGGEGTEGSMAGVVGLEGKDTAVCGGDGGACVESQCCAAGGPKGLQCYAKDDFFAACAPSCKPGVHEPEKEGSWGPDGVFHKAEWSCKELGKRSQPGCDNFDGSKSCPSSYCMWKGQKKDGKCLPKCQKFGSADGCWKSKHCMWEDDKCMDACWDSSSHSTCKPRNKCYWTGEKCQMGWWLFNDDKSCSHDLGYMWNGSCVKDPCSAPGEDCRKTQCCSTARGGEGTTCFQKNKDWATCEETCDDSKDWSCKKLGSRANYSAGCGWAGQSCASEKLCCNRGFVCAKKDATWTACVQTVKKTTWASQHIPIPAGWDGTILGAGRDEYQMQQAGPGEQKLGTTLYCWMAYLPGSYEEGLIAKARDNHASIYQCDDHDLFHTWKSASGSWDTGEATLTNTDVFINVWEQMAKVGTFMKNDWTVKVDPDCVMVADRLRSHLGALNVPVWAAVYVKNNGMDAGLGNNGFLGAIEVFSKKASMKYLDNAAGCRQSLGLNAGEDGYFKGCMDALGVGYVVDSEMFFPDHAAGACMNGGRAAFHPLKDPAEWQHCWDIIMGKSEW